MERKHWVMLSEMLKLVPLEKWPVLVDWVAAGGGFPSEIDLGRLRAQITTWSPQAVSWDAKKRPRLTDTKKDPEKGIASNLCDYEEPKDA